MCGYSSVLLSQGTQGIVFSACCSRIADDMNFCHLDVIVYGLPMYQFLSTTVVCSVKHLIDNQLILHR